jgi:hypothetical protein
MRVVSVVCLSLVVISFCLAEDTTTFTSHWYNLGYEKGINDAKGKSMFAWFAIGCLTGIPCTIVSSSAIVDPPKDMVFMDGKSYSFAMGYMDGYKKEIRNRRLRNALMGLIIQLVTVIFIIRY